MLGMVAVLGLALGAATQPSGNTTLFDGYGPVRWGASLKEARKALPDARLDAWPSKDLPRLVRTDKVSGRPARITYEFMDGKFARVELVFTDPGQGDVAVRVFDDVLGALMEKYGKPAEVDETKVPQGVSRGDLLVLNQWSSTSTWHKGDAVLRLVATELQKGPLIQVEASSSAESERALLERTHQALHKNDGQGL